MQIDMPKVSFGIGVAVMIETAIGGGTLSLTNMIPAHLIPVVQAWCNALAFVGATLLTGLHAYSGPSTGVLASPPTIAQAQQLMAVAKTTAAVLLLTLVLWPADAGAQTRPRLVPPTGDAVKDIKNAIGGQGQGSNENQGTPGGLLGDRAQSLLDKPFQDLANFIGDDIDAAITLSTVIPSLQDGNGQQCLMALKTFGDVVKAHPAPLTFKIASDLEAFRLKQMAVNRLCENTACTVVFADITQTITALSPMPLPIPSLHDLCSKVPTITIVTPVPVSAPVVTPAVTPPARQ